VWRGLIHVTGPSGAGKSSLTRMIMNGNVMVIDTDGITDPIERKHNANARLTANEREALIADEVRSAVRELYA
jgi:dephospho-CoA kinase